MKIRLETDTLELSPQQVLRIDDAHGVQVVCLRGLLWVTQSGELDDFFLSPFSSLKLEGPGPVLISAEQASRVLLKEPRRAPAAMLRIVRVALGFFRASLGTRLRPGRLAFQAR